MVEVNERYTRFKDALWFGTKEDVVICGSGGLGSWLALFLSRTGDHNIHIYDFDTFEIVNMAGQFVNNSSIGENKAIAISGIVRNFSGIGHRITAMPEMYTKSSMRSPIMFSCFDNMKSRAVAFNNWRSQFKSELPFKYSYLFVDARLIAENYQVYFVTPDKVEEYQNTLFDDDLIPRESCTFKSTSHFAAMASAKMVQGFTAFIANRKCQDDIYELPFSYKEDGPTFNIEIKYE